jgi:hypothetical protein
MGPAGPDAGTTAVVVAVKVAPGPAASGMPQTLKGVPEDVLEESEEEPRMVLKPVLEVVESASRPLVDFSVLNDNLIK